MIFNQDSMKSMVNNMSIDKLKRSIDNPVNLPVIENEINVLPDNKVSNLLKSFGYLKEYSNDVEDEVYSQLSVKGGLRLDFLKKEMQEHNINPVKVLKLISENKFNPLDLMVLVAGNSQGQNKILNILSNLGVIKES